MTAHDHATFVPGCYRCDLSRAEAEFEWEIRCVQCGRPYTPGRECRVGGECEPDD